MVSIKNLGKKNICDVQFVTSNDFNIQTLFVSLEKYIWSQQKVLVAVSGGVDSIFVSVLLYQYFLYNKIPLSQLVFVHLNHGVRNESNEEVEFVREFFEYEKWIINLIVKKRNSEFTDNDEANLRKWRYGQFAEICKENNVDFLVTGHHLNDRVESTFLHMLRGAGLDGFLSMRYCEDHHLLGNTKILRPLLNMSKKNIERVANRSELSFVVDQSNFDATVSKRNMLRNLVMKSR